MKIGSVEVISHHSDDSLLEKCAKIKHVALDMDGTIYMGSRLFPFTKDFLCQLEKMGITYSFLTNNPTKSRVDYLAKLNDMGIVVEPEVMYTTSIATIQYIKEHFPAARQLYALGTPSMIKEFTDAGFHILNTLDECMPDVLVVAFDTTLTYEKLCAAAWLAEKGIPYIATNPDRVCPTNLPTVLVDCGSLCECIAYATGRHPDHVIGKPNVAMLQGIMSQYGLHPYEIAMCGDRLYTDVKMAEDAGAFGVLVLSGESTMDTVNGSSVKADVVLPDIGVFGDLLKQANKPN